MARLTRRTVAPAKVSACQSDENDCTRAKAALVSSSMLWAAKLFIIRNAKVRRPKKPRYSSDSIAQDRQAPALTWAGRDTASISPPAAQGIDRSHRVPASIRASMAANWPGRRIQRAAMKPSTCQLLSGRVPRPPSSSSSS